MASYTIPDPLPVTRPTELDDQEFAEAVAANIPQPLSNIRDRASLLRTDRIVITFLILGQRYHSANEQGEEKRDSNIQGYYFLSVVYGRQNLIRQLRDAERRFETPGEQGAWQRQFSIRLIPLGPEEHRFEITGWGLREIREED